MERPPVLILGKLPPPYIGPAVATRIILESALNDDFALHHFDTRINEDVSKMGLLRPGKLKRVASMYVSFRKALKRIEPAVVLIPIAQTTAGFAKDAPFIRMAQKVGARVIIQLRGSEWRVWYDHLPRTRQKLVNRALEGVAGAIVLGENLVPVFEGIIPAERTYVVPNGGDYSFPERRRPSPAPVRLLYLANYLPGKGLLELLEGLRLLSADEQLPPWEFHAYGSWGSEAYKAACMRAARNVPACHLHGHIEGDAKWQALTDADVFVFAPRAPEGHPWSIVEALAAGLPVISTDRGAIRQSVLDGENGFLLEHPAPGDLANALAKLLKDHALRTSFGRASRRLYEAKFTSAAMTAHLGEVFKAVMRSS